MIGPLAEVAAGEPMSRRATSCADCRPSWPTSSTRGPHYFLTVVGDSMNRTGLQDGDIVAIHKTPDPQTAGGRREVRDEVTLKRLRRIDDRHVEFAPGEQQPRAPDQEARLAKHILDIDGIAVGALLGTIQDMTNR